LVSAAIFVEEVRGVQDGAIKLLQSDVIGARCGGAIPQDDIQALTESKGLNFIDGKLRLDSAKRPLDLKFRKCPVYDFLVFHSTRSAFEKLERHTYNEATAHVVSGANGD